MNREMLLFIRAFWYGGMLFLIYDCLRIFRRLWKHSGFLMSVEDVLYWLCSGLYLFGGFYRDNNGIIRGYILTGVLLGMLLWHFTVSRWFVKWSAKLLRIPLKKLGILIKRLKFWGIRVRILLNRVLHKRSRKKNGKKRKKKKKTGTKRSKPGKPAPE